MTTATAERKSLKAREQVAGKLIEKAGDSGKILQRLMFYMAGEKARPKFSKNATTLYVAQRISAVIDLDKIVLLENGEIVAMGNHEELMKSSPLYQEIYESQLGSGITAGLDAEVQK